MRVLVKVEKYNGSVNEMEGTTCHHGDNHVEENNKQYKGHGVLWDFFPFFKFVSLGVLFCDFIVSQNYWSLEIDFISLFYFCFFSVSNDNNIYLHPMS
jgi:hypothetical protein